MKSGTMIILVHDQLSFSREMNVAMSSAHHSPSSGGTKVGDMPLAMQAKLGAICIRNAKLWGSGATRALHPAPPSLSSGRGSGVRS
jgi:hypothetical protein